MSADYPLILVCWIDSARPVAAWIALEDIDETWCRAIECQSAGWQLPSDDDVVVLAANMGDIYADVDDATPQACGIIRIPRRAVTSITTLQPSTRGKGERVEIRKPHTPDQCDITRKPA